MTCHRCSQLLGMDLRLRRLALLRRGGTNSRGVVTRADDGKRAAAAGFATSIPTTVVAAAGVVGRTAAALPGWAGAAPLRSLLAAAGAATDIGRSATTRHLQTIVKAALVIITTTLGYGARKAALRGALGTAAAFRANVERLPVPVGLRAAALGELTVGAKLRLIRALRKRFMFLLLAMMVTLVSTAGRGIAHACEWREDGAEREPGQGPSNGAARRSGTEEANDLCVVVQRHSPALSLCLTRSGPTALMPRSLSQANIESSTVATTRDPRLHTLRAWRTTKEPLRSFPEATGVSVVAAPAGWATVGPDRTTPTIRAGNLVRRTTAALSSTGLTAVAALGAIGAAVGGAIPHEATLGPRRTIPRTTLVPTDTGGETVDMATPGAGMTAVPAAALAVRLAARLLAPADTTLFGH
jgi:hypothetical protein